MGANRQTYIHTTSANAVTLRLTPMMVSDFVVLTYEKHLKDAYDHLHLCMRMAAYCKNTTPTVQ